ncbi:cobalamin biosynthesis protein [Pseudomonas sp.]|uniref:cobalamin biosynthesis protein n=1 Tax=Pseudomonas sp. TaxID=306 RepID=UPI003D150D07
MPDPVDGRALHVAGLGCRQGCSRDELLDLLQRTLALQGLTTANLSGLASSEHKAAESGLLQLADYLHLPITFLPNADLARYHGRLSETSKLALRITGSAGVAEASALALAERLSGGEARLLVTKQKSANATLAVAITP